MYFHKIYQTLLGIQRDYIVQDKDKFIKSLTHTHNPYHPIGLKPSLGT